MPLRPGPKHFTNERVVIAFLEGRRGRIPPRTKDERNWLAAHVHLAHAAAENARAVDGLRAALRLITARPLAPSVPAVEVGNAAPVAEFGAAVQERWASIVSALEDATSEAERLVGDLGVPERILRNEQQLACALVALAAAEKGLKPVTPLEMEALVQLAGVRWGGTREADEKERQHLHQALRTAFGGEFTKDNKTISARRKAWKAALGHARRHVVPVLKEVLTKKMKKTR